MPIFIVCPVCKDFNDKGEELVPVTFESVDEWADHIIVEHPTDFRINWAKDHKKYLALQAKIEAEPQKEVQPQPVVKTKPSLLDVLGLRLKKKS